MIFPYSLIGRTNDLYRQSYYLSINAFKGPMNNPEKVYLLQMNAVHKIKFIIYQMPRFVSTTEVEDRLSAI